MKCPNCSYENEPGLKICKICGTELKSSNTLSTDTISLDNALKEIFGSENSEELPSWEPLDQEVIEQTQPVEPRIRTTPAEEVEREVNTESEYVPSSTYDSTHDETIRYQNNDEWNFNEENEEIPFANHAQKTNYNYQYTKDDLADKLSDPELESFSDIDKYVDADAEHNSKTIEIPYSLRNEKFNKFMPEADKAKMEEMEKYENKASVESLEYDDEHSTNQEDDLAFKENEVKENEVEDHEFEHHEYEDKKFEDDEYGEWEEEDLSVVFPMETHKKETEPLEQNKKNTEGKTTKKGDLITNTIIIILVIIFVILLYFIFNNIKGWKGSNAPSNPIVITETSESFSSSDSQDSKDSQDQKQQSTVIHQFFEDLEKFFSDGNNEVFAQFLNPVKAASDVGDLRNLPNIKSIAIQDIKTEGNVATVDTVVENLDENTGYSRNVQWTFTTEKKAENLIIQSYSNDFNLNEDGTKRVKISQTETSTEHSSTAESTKTTVAETTPTTPVPTTTATTPATTAPTTAASTTAENYAGFVKTGGFNGGSSNVSDTTLSKIRYGRHDAYNRIVFNFENGISGVPSYTSTISADGKTIDLSIQGVTGLSASTDVPSWIGASAMEIVSDTPTSIKITIHMNNPSQYKMFGLESPNRVVIDVANQ